MIRPRRPAFAKMQKEVYFYMNKWAAKRFRLKNMFKMLEFTFKSFEIINFALK